MAEFHGVHGREEGAVISTPVTADSGITVVIGATPVHTATGKTASIVIARTFTEAKERCGYSDNWEKYTACEAIYAHFMVHNVAPLIIINCLDPKKHKEAVQAEELTLTRGEGRLSFEAIKSSLKVKKEREGEALAEGTDYIAEYDDDALVVTALAGGKIADAGSCYVEYDKVKDIEKTDIVGGYDGATGTATGAELIDYAFALDGTIPGIGIAPGFSSEPEVAAVLAAKMETVGIIFKGGMAFCDIDAEATKVYSEVPAAKTEAGMTAANQYVCWPMVKLGDKVFHLSTLAAALTAAHDASEGDPTDSPSNLSLGVSGACLADGTEVRLLLNQANYLNSNGIATALSFMGVYRLWGNNTASYPADKDPSSYFMSMRRTKGWVINTMILTHWERVDRRQSRRLIDNVVDISNIWLNGIVATGHMLSASVSVTADDNPAADLLAGATRYRVRLGLCAPNEEMEFIVAYDPEAALAALGI